MRSELKILILNVVVTTAACLVAGEIWARLTTPHMTQATERQRSLEFEASLFSREALPQRPGGNG